MAVSFSFRKTAFMLFVAMGAAFGAPSGACAASPSAPCRAIALQPLNPAQLKLVEDAGLASARVTENQVLMSLMKLARTLKIPEPVLHALGRELEKKANSKWISGLSAFSISAYEEAVGGVGAQLGLELVFFPHPTDPERWQVALFSYGGPEVGAMAHFAKGLNFSLIFDMRKLDEYGGLFCGLSGSGTKGGGLSAGYQVSCGKDALRNLVLSSKTEKRRYPSAVSVGGTLGLGGGVVGTVVQYDELKRLEVREDELVAVAREWATGKGRFSKP